LVRLSVTVGLAVLGASPIALSRPIGAKPAAFSLTAHNLLINPDFESGYTRSVPCCNSIAVPVGWNIRLWRSRAAGIP
jgi:hypothetical protein